MKKAVFRLIATTTLLCSQFWVSPSVSAQVAGLSALPILQMPISARAAGLGFDFLSVSDADVALGLGNPALIDGTMHRQFYLGYMGLLAGVHFGSVGYAYQFPKLGVFAVGLQMGNYGRFEGYDEYDQPIGDFSAADYVLTLGWGRAIDEHVRIGANLKPILSHYERYTALAVGIDLAATYTSPNRAFSATLMGRNIGAQLLTFNGSTEKLPYNLCLSGSYKLQDAPFRLFFSINNLQRWDLRYDDPLNPTSYTDPFTGQVSGQTPVEEVADLLARHLGVGLEVTLRQSIWLRVGYNYRQMVEMTAADRFNTSGFSFGLGVAIKDYRISYSRNNYHLSQAPSYLEINTTL